MIEHPFKLLQLSSSSSCPPKKKLKDDLSNRSRAFAEAVVTMVWLVLLAAAINRKSEVAGLDVPDYVLILAGGTTITGICPLLACCIFNNPRTISEVTALFSAAILFSLAIWIASFTLTELSGLMVSCFAGLYLCCTMLRIFSYREEANKQCHKVRTKEFNTVLDGSHEFLCCMTGIHFLWLESLALESLISKAGHGIIQNDLSEFIGIVNILLCTVGLCTMLIEMAPPLTSTELVHIAGPLFGFDTFMVFSIGTVVVAAMWKSLVFPVLLRLVVGSVIFIGPLIAVLVLVLHVGCPEEAGSGQGNEPPKLAPLGLTKLMVTGFLTVSISISSPDVSISNWFLVFAAAAILSGLTWRLLTQAQVKKMLENKQEIIHVTQEPPTQDDEEREMPDMKDIISTPELRTQDKEKEMSGSKEVDPSRELLEQGRVWEALENNNSNSVSQARIDKTAAIASSAKTACFCAHIFVAIATVLLLLDICNVTQSTGAAAPTPAPART
uniref:Uncharacterized protein n=1 Tax=Avena sativa TaxID=4498 RepID=A0ACD5V305_AVESA